MARKRRSAAQRIAIAAKHGWICHISGLKIDPHKDRWELEHLIPLAAGGTDDDENLAPALYAAHKIKTKADVKRIAKTNRQRAQYFGAKRRGKPMPGSTRSGWKHKMDGSWERRS